MIKYLYRKFISKKKKTKGEGKMSSERSAILTLWAFMLLAIGAVGVAAGIIGVSGILFTLANIAYGLVQPLITSLLPFLVPLIDLL